MDRTVRTRITLAATLPTALCTAAVAAGTQAEGLLYAAPVALTVQAAVTYVRLGRREAARK
ncbi:hypothetical protein ACFP1Z_13895 [Streptomyces gamaensis]|uniref:Secreted protein n=1 Tax=Streptomyces gamaensis TaxID=1763542 RepID=A0ABW0YXD0_9ACTN